MRVITGTVRGRRLESLDGLAVRPTSEKVKEAVFSMIQFELPGAYFLDLFAGSGQMGIEALSREARAAVFVDAAPKCVAIIKENLERTGMQDRGRVVMLDAGAFLSASSDPFDIAFVDPPYDDVELVEVLALLIPRMREGGVVVCETDGKLEMPQEIGGFAMDKQRRYGRTMITVYRKGGDSR